MPKRMLQKDEIFQVTLLAVIEILTVELLNRSTPKSRRDNQLQALYERVKKIDETFDGCLSKEFIEKAEQFYAKVEDNLGELLQEIGE